MMFKTAKKILVTSLTFVFLMSAFTLTASAAQDMKNMSASQHKKMTQTKKVVKKPAAPGMKNMSASQHKKMTQTKKTAAKKPAKKK